MANGNVKILLVNRRNDGSGYTLHLASAHEVQFVMENLHHNKTEQTGRYTYGKFVALFNSIGVTASTNTVQPLAFAPNDDRFVTLDMQLDSGMLFKMSDTHFSLFQIEKHHNSIPVRTGIDIPSHIFFDGQKFHINTTPVENGFQHFANRHFAISAKTLTHKGKLHYILP